MALLSSYNPRRTLLDSNTCSAVTVSHRFKHTHNLTPTLVKHLNSFHFWYAIKSASSTVGITSFVMSSFPVTLLENPRQNSRHFHRAVIAAYGAEGPNIYTHGLLGFIFSDAQWAQLPGNLVQPDDDAILPVVPLVPRSSSRPHLPLTQARSPSKCGSANSLII